MNKRILSLGLLAVGILSQAQVGAHYNKAVDSDTLKVHEIEDIRLHKTGNPNQARTSSTKSGLTVMETPQPIAIVTHEVIEAQQSKQLSDVVRNVNGVYIASSRGSAQDSFGARGFTFGSDNVFKNGLKVNSGVYPEVSGLERVEVLKGANAMLYGNVSAGGIVNMITKKPRFDFGGSVSANVGSWNNYKPTIDIYGPLTDKIAYRVNGTYEYAESFRDVVNSKKNYFNPSFVFNIGENTQIIVEGDYLYNHSTPDFGIGSIVDSKTGISSLNNSLKNSDFLGTSWQYQTVQQATTDVIINHQFNKNWYLNSVIGYSNYTKDYFSTERITWALNNPSLPDYSWKRPLNRTYSEQNYTSGQINLNGEFNTGKIHHKVLMGADADYGTSDSYTYYNPENGKLYGTSYFYGVNGNPNGLISMNNLTDIHNGAMPASERSGRTRIPTVRYGVYVQDFISLSKKFNVIAGLRYSSIQNKDSEIKDFRNNTENTKEGTKDHAFSPKVGLVYTPNENLTIYGTYTNSFTPNTGFDIDGNSLKPSIIDQYELGMKKNILNNAVSFNLSLYQIEQGNTYASPYLESGNTATYKVYAGTIRSRGVELDITGNPTKELSLIGGISYNNTVYTKTPDDGYVENQKLVRTPATTVNASAFYTFKNSGLKGLIIGASAFYTGDRQAGWNDLKGQKQVTRLIDVDGYTTVDFSLGYQFKKVLLQGKLGNIFNTQNYNIHENYSINPTSPRFFYFTLTYKL